MHSSLFVFPSDLVAEGVDTVLRRVRDRGVDTVSLAVSYHQARDLTPHGSGRTVHRADGLFLAGPDEVPDLWHGVRLRPPRQDPAEMAAVAELFDRAGSDGALAWTVFLHNTTLGTANPDAAGTNCFGDPLRADLCPANPDVTAYAVALARTVVRVTGAPVVAEALSYGTYEHGHHHERCFVPLGDGERVLLGLCFCAHCQRAVAGHGADPERLRARIARHLDAALAGAEPTPAEPDALIATAGDDLAAMFRAREEVVATLTGRVADAVHAGGGRLVLLDLTGAVLGYGAGEPVGAPAAAQGWRIGVDPARLAGTVDGYTCLGYARDPDRLRTDVVSVVDAVAGRCPVRVVLRPGWPDTDDAAHLTAKVAACALPGVDAVDYYHYGMYPWPVLDRIPAALPAAGSRE